MKTKKIFSLILAASMMAACTNEGVVESNDILKGQMIDATNFELVGSFNGADAESRASYLPQYVYLDGTNLVAGVVKPVWESNDAIGFSHIYPTDQRLVTNYRFDIATGVGLSTGATFTTTNSTIFAGDYFVYYPFNEDYHDYDGIPFALDHIQTQDATASAVVKVDQINPTTYSAADEARLRAAGEHLTKYRFSIGNRINVAAAVNQTNFALNQYTSTLAFLIWPKNQTNTIHIQRIEMVSANGTALEIPVEVRFNAEAGNDEPVPAVVEGGTEDKAVLLFENVADGGLEILANGTKNNATLGYMSMIPNTYANGTYKFVVYYQENGIMKKREVASYKDLVLESNTTTFYNIELDANGAVEVVDNEIWTETEFASAVAKSNRVTNGEVVYTIMQNITLKNSYDLTSDVPVTFNGGQTVTLVAGKYLRFNSAADILFDNVVSAEAGASEAKLIVAQGNVEVKGVNSDNLALGVTTGEVTILNADAEGELMYVNNKGTLTLENVAIVNDVQNGLSGSADAELALSDATIGGNFDTNSAGGSVALDDVVIDGDWVNTKGDLTAKTVTVKGKFNEVSGARSNAAEMEDVNVYGQFSIVQELNLTGTNVLAINPTTTPATNNRFVTWGAKVNVKNSNTTIGKMDNSKLYLAEGSTDAVTFTVKGATELAASYVFVDVNATFNAEGELTGLKGDGTPANSTMVLEGKLTTDDEVELAGDFSICGTVENKANGLWTLDNAKGVLKFNHAHTTSPEFTNAGKVVVEGIKTTAEVTSIANVKMAADLYDAESTGILEWKGMENLANVNAIYALGAGCYATDLHATVATSTTENFTADLNWSNKNIIVTVADAEYKGTFDAGKKFSAKNFTVNTEGTSVDTSFTFNGGTTDLANNKYVVNVTETLSLNNNVEYAGMVDLTSAICKDLTVYNEDDATSAIFSIKNGLRMNYTDTYVPSGDNYNITWVNDKPVKK